MLRRMIYALCGAVCSLIILFTSQPLSGSAAQVSPPSLAQFGQWPLLFEANAGQTNQRVKFLARGNGYGFFLTQNEAVLRLRSASADSPAIVRMRLQDASAKARISPRGDSISYSNYLMGNDPRAWRTHVKQYERIEYANVYPGIDLIWYGNQQQLEHDFLVHPNANPQRIGWRLAGARSLQVDADGALVLSLANGASLRWLKPQAWQAINNERRPVICEYALKNSETVAFRLGDYDKSLPLVIDPVLSYSSYLGGHDFESVNGVTVDSEGNAYVTGTTDSTTFPTLSNGLQPTPAGRRDAFVLKLNPSGTALIYATWLGGTNEDVGKKISVDATGNVVVVGSTFSTDFPLRNPLQATRKGGEDVFVSQLNAAGTALVFSTFLGGSFNESAEAVGLDANGNMYVAGNTYSKDFPLQSALQNTKAGNLISLSANGGGAWNNAANTGLEAAQVNDLAIDPKTPATLYAATERGLFRSTNSGANWSLMLTGESVPEVNQVAIDPMTTSTLYARAGIAVYKSVNAGAAWQRVNYATGVPSIATVLAVDAARPSTLYIGGRSGFFKSTDSGTTWTSIPVRDDALGPNRTPMAVALHPQIAQTIFVMTLEGVLKTTNGGTNWTYVEGGLPQFTIAEEGDQVLFSQNNHAVMWVRRRNEIHKSTDGGVTWTRNGLSVSGNAKRLALDPTNANIVYAGTAHGIVKTTDGGATWLPLNSGLTTRNTKALAIAPSTPQTLYAGSDATADGFVSKFNASGSALLFSTYLGGTDTEDLKGVSVDGGGAFCLTGTTHSVNFPLANAFQSVLSGPTDAFVTKFIPNATTPAWSTYLGGSSFDGANGVAIMAGDGVVVAGFSHSTNFPLSRAVQSTNRSTAAQADAFVTRFSSDGRTLDFSTYLGGDRQDEAKAVWSISLNADVLVAGTTTASNFPLINSAPGTKTSLTSDPGTNRAEDVFLARISANGATLMNSSVWGGDGLETVNAMAVDIKGGAYIVGNTNSENLLVTTGAFQRQIKGFNDGFITRLGINADLAVSLTDAPDPVMANGLVTVTLKLTNEGNDEAQGVGATITPSAQDIATISWSQGSCSGPVPINCQLGDLAAKASATVTVTVVAPVSGPLTTRATATSNSADVNMANNTATQETRIVSTPSIFGRVTTNGAGLSGVSLNLTGAQRPVIQTTGDGVYQFAELANTGNYTVTPSRSGYAFTPPSRAFNNLTRDAQGDFTAVACVFSLAQRMQSFSAIGGTGSVTLTATDAQCPWTARSNVPWITMNSAANGNGTTTIRFTVAPTIGARQGTLTLGGNTLTVYQEFNACSTFGLVGNAITATLPATPVQGEIPGALRSLESRTALLRDFNKDGRLDLVATGFNAGRYAVFVFPGQANNAWGAATLRQETFGLNTPDFRFAGLAAADFNQDSNLDLATLTWDSSNRGRLWILNGNGAGGFAAPRAITVPTQFSTAGLGVGDVNNDNLPDAVVSSGGSPHGWVYLNDGAGGWRAPRNLPAALDAFGEPDRIEITDLDDDGKRDLWWGRVAALKGDGTGNFSLIQILPTANRIGALAYGDFNGDGKADLIYTGVENDRSQLMIDLNDGSGRFVAGPRITVNVRNILQEATLLTGDFNLDGRADVIVRYAGGWQALFSVTGNRLLGEPQLYLSSSPQLQTPVIADLNRDSRPDLLFLYGDATETMLNQGGAFSGLRGFRFADSSSPRLAFAVGDVNGDGLADAVTAGTLGNELKVMLGNGRAEFVPLRTFTTTLDTRGEAMAMALRDFNRDGRLDLAVLYQSARTVEIWLNNGRGEFTSRSRLNVGTNATKLRFADFNGDSTPDLVTNSSNGGLGLYLGNGLGDFSPSVIGIGGPNVSGAFEIADFNGDRRPDLLWLEPTPSEMPRYLWLPGNGQGSFNALEFISLPRPSNDVVAADLNNDGRADLIYRATTEISSYNVVLSEGATGWAAPDTYLEFGIFGGGPPPRVADLNGDGKLDFYLQGLSVVRLGRGDGTFLPAVQVSLGADVSEIVITDADSDGVEDFVAMSNSVPALGIVKGRASCYANGVAVTVSAASYAPHRVAANGIYTIFGVNLAAATQSARTNPLPTVLGNTSLRLRDSAGNEQLAPLFFVSAGQINFLLPPGLAAGLATLTVLNGSTTVATGTLLIVSTAPGLFTANASGQGLPVAVALRVRANGSQVYESISRVEQNRVIPIPLDVSNAAEQVYLVLYGTGWRNRTALAAVTAQVGGLSAEVSYAGGQGGFAGLDQFNLRLPSALAGRGEVLIDILVDGRALNSVSIFIQ